MRCGLKALECLNGVWAAVFDISDDSSGTESRDACDTVAQILNDAYPDVFLFEPESETTKGTQQP